MYYLKLKMILPIMMIAITAGFHILIRIHKIVWEQAHYESLSAGVQSPLKGPGSSRGIYKCFLVQLSEPYF